MVEGVTSRIKAMQELRDYRNVELAIKGERLKSAELRSLYLSLSVREMELKGQNKFIEVENLQKSVLSRPVRLLCLCG